eukprot:2470786-Rhodomonas_salina.2
MGETSSCAPPPAASVAPSALPPTSSAPSPAALPAANTPGLCRCACESSGRPQAQDLAPPLTVTPGPRQLESFRSPSFQQNDGHN